VSEKGPGREYLEALARELRVSWRYRRRVIAEIAAHIDEAVERERRLGAGMEEAERVAVRRLGPVGTVADGLAGAHREAVAAARERALRTIASVGAAVVVACASLARLTTGDSDAHLGLEAAAAIAVAIAVLLIDVSQRASRHAGVALACVTAFWIATTAALVSDGEIAFCGITLLAVGAAATIVYGARRVRFRPRRGSP
jgi:hypothetical protein